MRRHLVSLLCFIALVSFIAAIGNLVTVPAVDSWYQELRKPAWNPPNWLFGPVWTTLYIFIAIAGWRVWCSMHGMRYRDKFKSRVMAPYWSQLALNFFWSIFFFGMQDFRLAAVDIMALLVAIGCNIRVFAKRDKLAAALLVPYFLWVLYATSLNMGIMLLNPA